MLLFGLIVGLVGTALVLPLVSFFRTVQLQRELSRLQEQLDVIERKLAVAVPLPQVVPADDGEKPVVVPPKLESPARTIRPIESPANPPLESPPSVEEPFHPLNSPRELDLEERIGGRWFQHAGLVVLLLGIAFFLRYAFEHAWLSPAIRVGLGAVTGIAMTGGGLRLSRGYGAYGLLLVGGGVAVLYLSVYAGLNLYDLFNTGTAFGLLVLITVAAAVVADRSDSQALAFVAVCGGFATPFLVGGNRDEQLTLFSYVALLVMATMYLAHRRRWPWLNVASLALTSATVLVWAFAYYTDSKYLRTELFLTLYCAMFLEMLRRSWGGSKDGSTAVALLVVAPLAYHVWSIVTLAPHGLAFLIYLIAFTVLLVGVGVHYSSSLLRVAAWVAMALPLGSWIEAHHWRGWLFASVTAIVGICAVHAAAQIRAVANGDELDGRDVGLLHANGIGVYAALYQVLTDTLSIGSLAGLAVFLAGVNAAIWVIVRRNGSRAAVHWLGVAFTLVAIAVWVQLGGPWAVAAWATEGAVVYWIGVTVERRWLRVGALVLFGLAAFRWLQPDIQQTTVAYVVLANARALTGVYIVAALYLAAWIQARHAEAASLYGTYERGTLVVSASVVTVAVISAEIVSFWALRTTAPDADVARQMMLSAAWVMYAALIVVIGMRWKYAPIRYFAIILFGVALAKVFFVDLETLGGVYRVAGFIVIGLVLLLVSFLYQRAGGELRLKSSD